MEEGEFKVSPRYEFDAPHYYDFQREEPQSPEPADEWFNTSKALEASSPPGCLHIFLPCTLLQQKFL